MTHALQSAWRVICATAFWLWLTCRCYKLGSWLHRTIYDRQYEGTPVTAYDTLADLRAWIDQQQWVADDWDDLFDAVCTPNKVQAVGQGDHKIGDCDEFAIYQVAAIEKSLALGAMVEDGIGMARFLTVTWINGWKTAGHNVCLLTHPEATDGKTWLSYVDYDVPSTKRLTVAEVARDVRVQYGGPEARALGFAVQGLDLTPESVKWGGI